MPMQILDSIRVSIIRHDNDLHADNKNVQKNLKLMICICSEFYAEKTFDNKPCKYAGRC